MRTTCRYSRLDHESSSSLHSGGEIDRSKISFSSMCSQHDACSSHVLGASPSNSKFTAGHGNARPTSCVDTLQLAQVPTAIEGAHVGEGLGLFFPGCGEVLLTYFQHFNTPLAPRGLHPDFR